MRLTNALFKHNMWRVKKFNWQQQSKRRILDTKVKDILVQRNIEIVDANEVSALPKPYIDIKSLNIAAPGPIKPQPGTKEHPSYHEERIRIYKDNNVLLEGIDQAKLLTNTIEPTPKKVLPQQLTNLIGAVSYPNQDQLVKRCINNSLVYDAEQVKLPIRKDPERPAWIFPRDYGISHKRRNFLLSKRLLQLCETISQLSGNRVSEERFIVDDACFSVPLKWNDDQLLFDLRADLLVASKSALSPIAESQKYNDALPDISPLLPTVSLDETNFYQFKNKFPMKSGPQGLQVHTAIVHYNETEVGNLFESEVLKSQILGRTLMKAYTFAVAQARQNYGPESKGQLPVPVTVQTVHTNGQWFHFSLLQLNTFEMNTDSLRNYFWSAPFLNLYSFCGYEEGRPVLKSYNPDVFKTLLAFYNNQC